MRRRNVIPRNERQTQAKERALAALGLMRREGLRLRPAAIATGIDPRTVWRYAGSALRQKRPGGRVRSAAYDRIPRAVNLLTSDGEIPVVVRDSRTASLIAQHKNAVQTYGRGNGGAGLERFKGKSFRAGGVTYSFVTDTGVLDRLVDAGVPTEGLYRAVHGMGV